MTRPPTVVRPGATAAGSGAGPRQRGLAALSVVMVLFFVMALVAAYTNRNLLFEQRISANHYRSTRALAAADAGVDWALAMLNAGRVNINCEPSTDAGDSDFRSRYLDGGGSSQAVRDGGYEIRTWGAAPGTKLYPACVSRDGVLSCICPTTAQPTPTLAGVPADGIGSSHRITFLLPGAAVRPGTIEFAARGCASPGSGNTACYAPTTAMPAVDALATTLSTAGLLRALPVVPPATLTAGGTVTADPGAGGNLQVSNADPGSGLTVRAGAAVNAPASVFQGPAGSGSDGVRQGDATLAALAAAASEGWFRGVFGMDSDTYRRQPAAVRVDCTAGCSLAQIADALDGHPRNPVWIDGNLTLDGTRTMGSAADPLLLLVSGTLTLAADVDITGFVHAGAVSWTSSAASLRGALVTRGDFTATSTATLAYDRAVLDQIHLRYGSFVRVPGSWNLTPVNFN